MSKLITDMSDNGAQHKSASQRRELALRTLLMEKEALTQYLQSLVTLLLNDRGGAATYPVESLKKHLGAKFDSTFNEGQTEITFTVKEEVHDKEDEGRLQSDEREG